MGPLHKLKGDGKTFALLVESAANQDLHEGTGSSRIDIVFDVYRDASIKNAERCNQGSNTGTYAVMQWKNTVPGHNILQRKKFPRTLEKKMSLVNFMVKQWKQPQMEKLQDKSRDTWRGILPVHRGPLG
jgi:hypothetical protein